MKLTSFLIALSLTFAPGTWAAVRVSIVAGASNSAAASGAGAAGAGASNVSGRNAASLSRPAGLLPSLPASVNPAVAATAASKFSPRTSAVAAGDSLALPRPAAPVKTRASASQRPASVRSHALARSANAAPEGAGHGSAPRSKPGRRGKLYSKAVSWAKVLDVRSHIAGLSDLLDVEHAAEVESDKRAVEGALQLRETLGTSVSGLSLQREEKRAPGGSRVVLLSKPGGGAKSPFHALRAGDPVTLAGPGGAHAEGIVYGVRGNRLAVSVEETEELPHRGIRVDLTDTDVTHRRMKAALDELNVADKPHTLRLRDVLLGRAEPRTAALPQIRFRNRGLDEFQREAVRRALAAEDVAVIHGPPGTGKTTTLVELIYQAAKRGEKVLATAPSNVAADNILEKLAEAGLKVVRLGHPARTAEHLRRLTVDAVGEKSDEGRLLATVRKQLEGLRPGSRDYEALSGRIRFYERKIRRKVMEGADVVVATHGGIRGRLLREDFDLAVLDEASQAVEPLSWIPLLQAKRAVLAGDPEQLPPTLRSEEARERGLGRTLMERLMGILPEGLQSLLRKQYRMNEDIMGFSSEEFYGGKLIADPSVAGHTAKDLPGVKESDLTRVPVQFVDTAGAGFEEGWDRLTRSRVNEREARLTAKILKNLTDSGLRPDQIGVITPYAAQARLVRELAGEGGPEIETVDGFQGREKEVIVVSMVRSNPDGEIGFLEDLRRLNVALTRARRSLIVVGDGVTLARHPTYARFIAHAARRGKIRSAAEWVE
ncbi:MAG: AAA domain-containing protein [Elusimicrobiota bacterium]